VIRGVLITPFETVPGGAVVVEDGRITYVGAEDEAEVPARTYDFHGDFVAPGFIDLHTHGGAGFDVMDATAGALDGVAGFLAAGGVTSFLPTASSAPHENLMALAHAVKTVMDRGPLSAEVLGLHLEGPYLNPARRGAQDAAYIRPPDIDEVAEIQREAGGAMRMLTLAPEAAGALEMAGWLRSQGVVPAVGHTDATYVEMEGAVDSGFRHVSHLFNGMRPFHHRDPGVVGAALTDDGVTVDVIADGVHLHPAALRLTVATKGAERTALVSDSIGPAGLPDGEYLSGGRRVILESGRCLLELGVLAGSTIRLCEAVRNMMELTGRPLTEAVEMASTTPARIIGAADRKGRLEPGLDADLTVFDRRFNVLLTMVGGRVVYERGARP
ncbi:MAG: N-acetylglucosamine-6-phosphate deacetylase, partial [Candidatus Bathyarchaeia archaeon]